MRKSSFKPSLEIRHTTIDIFKLRVFNAYSCVKPCDAGRPEANRGGATDKEWQDAQLV